MESLGAELARMTEDQRQLYKLLLAQQGVDPSHVPIERRPQSGPAPLSFTQERLWRLGQLAAGTAWGNVPLALVIDGPLDVPRLGDAVRKLVQRHETLRTWFRDGTGGPWQIVEPEPPFAVAVADLRGVRDADRPAELLRRVAAAARRPFDLTRAPLLHAEILQTGADAHVLLLVMHHLTVDGWAIRQLLQELSTLYAGLASEPLPSPATAVQYDDFAAWQREWLVPELLGPQLTYWRDQLRGSAILQLPGAPTGQRSPSYRGDVFSFALPAALSDALRALGRAEGATAFMTLLAGFQALLHKYTGQTDVAVATAMSNRNRPEVERMVGNFANNLLLRVDLSGDPPFRELLARVRSVVMDAYGHQDVPLEVLAGHLAVEGATSPLPPIRAIFILRNSSVERALDLPGVTVRRLPADPGAAGLDLAIDVTDGGPEMTGTVEYRTDLFEEPAVAELVRQYQRLLEAAAADAGVRLSQLPEPVVWPVRMPPAGPGGWSLTNGRAGAAAPAAPVAPRTDLERRLVEIWERVLGVRPVGVRDSFFELGGHSLLLSQLAVAIEQAFGSSPPLQALFERPTIEEFAAVIAGTVPAADAWAALYPIKPTGTRGPLVAVHSEHGFFDAMAAHLPTDQPLYGLMAHGGADGSVPPYHPCTSLEEMADRYLERLRQSWPGGPFLLVGYCAGGLVAYEMARRMAEQGEQPAFLCLLDAFPFEVRDDLAGPTRTGFWLRARRRLAGRKAAILAKMTGAACHLLRALGRSLPPRLLWLRGYYTGARALSKYVAGPYPGRMTLICSSVAPPDGVACWSRLVGDGLDVCTVSGTHLGIMHEPDVRDLAAKLIARLQGDLKRPAPDAVILQSAPVRETGTLGPGSNAPGDPSRSKSLM